MLNDIIIDFYLRYILHELVPVERRDKVHLFNTFFYSRLSQIPPLARTNVTPATRAKRLQANYNQIIKNWTKKVDLFQMDYVVVPINEDIHWYLAIIVNPSGGIVASDSSSVPSSLKSHSTRGKKPAMLVLFNSLLEPAGIQKKSNQLVYERLTEYLQLEYNDKKADNRVTDKEKSTSQIFDKNRVRLITPEDVPQQANYIDCGLFLLQFAELFLTDPPELTTTEKRVSFEGWFPKFNIKGKRGAIRTLIKRLAPEVQLYSDFHPTASRRKKLKKATSVTAASIKENGHGESGPKLARRHSESSLLEMEREKDFKLVSHHRSLDSLLDDLKGQPPLQITFKRAFMSKKRRASGH